MLSCNKSPENEISGRAEHTSFCSFYFMNNNGGKRLKKNSTGTINMDWRNKHWNTRTGRLAGNPRELNDLNDTRMRRSSSGEK